jgi:hypothetical protein
VIRVHGIHRPAGISWTLGARRSRACKGGTRRPFLSFSPALAAGRRENLGFRRKKALGDQAISFMIDSSFFA